MPSLSSDTLRYSNQWTNIDDKTGSSDGFAICIVTHTQMFKAMDEYDKTESSDEFVMVMLKHTGSKKWTNMTRLNLVMFLPSLLLDTLRCSPAMDEYDDKTESSDGFAVSIFRHTQMSTSN